MRPPPRVNIGPRRYTITSSDVTTDGHDALGLCQPSYELITLSPSQGPATMRETLLHEVMHACFHAAVPFGGLVGDKTEEKVCSAVAPHLLDALRRNPRLVAYLLSAD